jgi:peptidoglycan/LPS O-acetylase OafA/YrhL
MSNANSQSSPPHEPRPQIVSLTSLRFFAATAIVVYHAFGFNNAHLPAASRGPLAGFLFERLPLFCYAHLAVDFFFILSGFVLAHVYLDALASGQFDYARFLKRRLARIYPLHAATALACLLLFAGATAVGHPLKDSRMFSLPAIVANFLMVHAWGVVDHLSVNGPSWSVSAEWFAYLLFPLAAWAVLRSPLGSITTLVAAVGVFLGVYYLDVYVWASPPLLTERTFDFGILRIGVEFPIGVALYRVFRERPHDFARPWQALAAVLLTLLAMQFQWEQALVVLLFAALIYFCAANESADRLRPLAHRWLVYGGEISYSIYLVHAPLLACVAAALALAGVPKISWTSDFVFLASIPAVIAVSIASYEWLERPANRWVYRVVS